MTTDLRIKDQLYDLESTFANAQLNVLVYMTKRIGVTMKSIVGGLQEMDRSIDAAKNAGGDGQDATAAAMMEILSTEAGLDAFRGLVWLARTHAGERTPEGKFFTLDEANEGVGFSDFDFVNDGAVDPTELEAPASPSSSTISSGT